MMNELKQLWFVCLQISLCLCVGPVLTPLGITRIEQGQELTLVCMYSTPINAGSDVYVDWSEDGTKRGSLDQNCDDTFSPVDLTQYNFSCPDISNYVWTILNITSNRNGTSWKCEMAINTSPYDPSNDTTIYVIEKINGVTLNASSNISIEHGQPEVLSCITSGGRPESDVLWFLDKGTPLDEADDEKVFGALSSYDFINEVTTSILVLSGEQRINGWIIYCKANNTASMISRKSNNATIYFTEVQSSTTTSPLGNSSQGPTTTISTLQPTTIDSTTDTSTHLPPSTTITSIGVSTTRTSLFTNANNLPINPNSTLTKNKPATASTTTQTIFSTITIAPPRISKTSDESRIVLIAVCSSIGGIFVISIVVRIIWNGIRKDKSPCYDNRPTNHKPVYIRSHHLRSTNRFPDTFRNQKKRKQEIEKNIDEYYKIRKAQYYSYTFENKEQLHHYRPTVPRFNDVDHQLYNKNGWQRTWFNNHGSITPITPKGSRPEHIRHTSGDPQNRFTMNPLYTERPSSLPEIGHGHRHTPSYTACKQQADIRPQLNRTTRY